MAKKKIYISPSDQTNNKYAGVDTTEAVVCRKIGKELEKELDRCGFDSTCNTTSGMYARIDESNRGKYDVHFCIHTNAFNKKTTGTRIFVYSTSGEAYKLAKSIFNELAPLTPGTSENISVNKSFAEIKNTTAICIYIEVDFHDVANVAKWLASNTTKIAEAIAEGTCKHYGVKYVAKAAAAPTPKSFNVKVTTDELNVRNGAGTNYKIVGTANKGDVYTIVDTKSVNGVKWGKIKFVTGWISLKYTANI